MRWAYAWPHERQAWVVRGARMSWVEARGVRAVRGRVSCLAPIGAALGPDLSARWLGWSEGASPELMAAGIWAE